MPGRVGLPCLAYVCESANVVVCFPFRTCVHAQALSTVVYAEESFRVASVVLVPFTGSAVSGWNTWRRFVKAHLSPFAEADADSVLPLAASAAGIPLATYAQDNQVLSCAMPPPVACQ